MNTLKKIRALGFGILLSISVQAQTVVRFSSLDSVFAYADRNNIGLKASAEQNLLAKWTKIASIGNTINLRSPITANWTDNTNLAVSYLPAEIFGGAPGTFKAVSLGQEYVSSFGITPQLDIINPAAWAKVKSASLNEQLSQTNQQIARKNLFESLAATYYNIVSIQQQIQFAKSSEAQSDSIWWVMKQKFEANTIREQDVNNALINKLSIQDRRKQLEFMLEQNYISLRILCDLDPNAPVEIVSEAQNTQEVNALQAETSGLLDKQFELQSAFLKNELRVNRLSTYSPTLSLVFNQAWQQNSNVGFRDSEANKFNTQYIGLRLNIPFPLDVNRISANYQSKISFEISKLNAQHQEILSNYQSKQLNIDLAKATSTYTTNLEISRLKSINYSKNESLYNEGLISSELLMNSLIDQLNAQQNVAAAYAGLKFAEEKIKLNNTIK